MKFNHRFFGIFNLLLLTFVSGFHEKEEEYDRHINQKGIPITNKKVLDSSFFPSRPPTRKPTSKPSTPPPSNYYGQLGLVNYFIYSGIVQSVTVPSGCTSIYIYMWGAGGSGNGRGYYTYYGGGGGAGAYVEGTLPVTPGSTLSVIVGGGGNYGSEINGAFGGGGGGSNFTGGGRSAIQFNGEDLVTAGGGGGADYEQGGAATSFSSGHIQVTAFQGSYYDNTAKATTQCNSYGSGGGGSNATGGCGYPNYGTKYQGGAAGGSFGGGGGGGYYGGGGGDGDYASGGGGSSYLAHLTTFNLSQSALISTKSCNGQYSVYYNESSCGTGGHRSSSVNGQNGLVVIRTSPLYSTYLPSAIPTEYPTLVPSTSSPSISYGPLNLVNYFAYTGTIQTVAVPVGVSSIYIYMWGGGGAGYMSGSYGGAGAYVEGTLPVTPGSTLSVIVAGGGSSIGGFGGGGQSGFYKSGGGRSAIQLNGEDIVTAGGGGGSGAGGNNQYHGGAAASYSDGQIQSTSFQGGSDVMSSSCYLLDTEYYYYYSSANKAAGGGGSAIRGGCGNPNNGTKYQGGAGVGNGGGGGGGYFGGGGGGDTDSPGGGGSSYLSQLTTYSLSQSGTGFTCSGQYSVYYNMTSCGSGGSASTAAYGGSKYGQNGLVVIRTSPLYSSFSPSAKPSMLPTVLPSTSPPSTNYGQLTAVNIFHYTGTLQWVTVPSGVTAIYVYMWGAGGANGTILVNNNYVEGYPGGAGAYVEGTLPITTSGSSLAIQVGGGGSFFNTSSGVAHQGSFGGGGGCTTTSSCQPKNCFCTGGGGRSAIQLNGEDILTAGGGGGGGSYNAGGAATSYSNGQIQTTSYTSGYGVPSTFCRSYNVAGGGSNTTGGCGHPNDGMKYQGGGTQGFYGGGGGGGYYGGGGGQSDSSYGGGGGGGSSYLDRLTSFSLSESGATNSPYCNGQYSSYFNASDCGGGNGQNGLVVITLVYSPTSSPATVFRTPTSPTKVTSMIPSSSSPSQTPTTNPTKVPSMIPSCAPSQSLSSYPSPMPSLFPTTAIATNQDFFASQSISGLNISQYSSSSTYQTVLIGTIVQAFASPTINSSQVINLLVSAGTSSRRRRLSTSSSSIVASYQIVVNSQFPVNAYSSQLTASVSSGAFSNNLHVNAENAGAAGFVNATSGPVSVAATPLVPSASPVSSPSSGGNLSAGAIAGIVLGVVAFVCLIGAIGWWMYVIRLPMQGDAAPKDKVEMVNPLRA